MSSIQPSKLLASLFQHVDDEERLSVLDVGPAQPETVNFFSHYRCKLYFADIFSELPIVTGDEDGPTLSQQFDEFMQFPANSRFDICLFWDLFNYLSSEAIAVFLAKLRPCLHSGSMAHGFAMHTVKSPQGDQLYGISQADAFRVRHRDKLLPGFAPHGQTQLKSQLSCFSFDRTVLLSGSRLEFVLKAKR